MEADARNAGVVPQRLVHLNPVIAVRQHLALKQHRRARRVVVPNALLPLLPEARQRLADEGRLARPAAREDLVAAQKLLAPPVLRQVRNKAVRAVAVFVGHGPPHQLRQVPAEGRVHVLGQIPAHQSRRVRNLRIQQNMGRFHTPGRHHKLLGLNLLPRLRRDVIIMRLARAAFFVEFNRPHPRPGQQRQLARLLRAVQKHPQRVKLRSAIATHPARAAVVARRPPVVILRQNRLRDRNHLETLAQLARHFGELELGRLRLERRQPVVEWKRAQRLAGGGDANQGFHLVVPRRDLFVSNWPPRIVVIERLKLLDAQPRRHPGPKQALAAHGPHPDKLKVVVPGPAVRLFFVINQEFGLFEILLKVIAPQPALGQVPPPHPVHRQLGRIAPRPGFEHGHVEACLRQHMRRHSARRAGPDNAHVVDLRHRP